LPTGKNTDFSTEGAEEQNSFFCNSYLSEKFSPQIPHRFHSQIVFFPQARPSFPQVVTATSAFDAKLGISLEGAICRLKLIF